MKQNRKYQLANHKQTTQIRSSITNGLSLIRGALGATLLLIKSI